MYLNWKNNKFQITMRTIVLLFAFILAVSSSRISKSDILKNYENKPTKEVFKAWHYAFEKEYDLNSEEGLKRYRIFKENINYIKKVNSEEESFKLGLGPFTDLTFEEFTSFAGSKNELTERRKDNDIDMADFFLDEEEPGWYNECGDFDAEFTEVPKGRHHERFESVLCGRDISYTLLKTMFEYYIEKKGFGKVKLSLQNIYDCALSPSDERCLVFPHLTLLQNAYLRKGGFYKEENYPTLSTPYQVQACQDSSKKFDFTADVTSCTALSSTCTLTIKKEICKNGPYYSTILMTQDLQHFDSGIYNSKRCKNMSHVQPGLVVSIKEDKVRVLFGLGKDFADNGRINFSRDFALYRDSSGKQWYHSCGAESEMQVPFDLAPIA